MSRAICKNCGAINYWRAQRGMKLSDLKCSNCEKDLEAYNEKKHGYENGKRKIISAIWK